ncbi:hypothetical protein GQ55_8G254800 [Panicum hallii var. hallii]|uniref:Uncharacterized protein n=1 Tax=Panicum hallii var. hallii TaxID=1504633 RepID=A0A2T7CR54_9POAL|nr:hypothetical protein GQ55_8G254800 [Panicum hallii var. hallii]
MMVAGDERAEYSGGRGSSTCGQPASDGGAWENPEAVKARRVDGTGGELGMHGGEASGHRRWQQELTVISMSPAAGNIWR